jgi:hypothetical protein
MKFLSIAGLAALLAATFVAAAPAPVPDGEVVAVLGYRNAEKDDLGYKRDTAVVEVAAEKDKRHCGAPLKE